MSLELIASLMIAHGYPLLFTIIALDCAFLPIPGELLLLTFGGIAVQAQFDLGIGIAVAALAVLVGDSISYWLGRFGGKRVMNKFRFAQGWTLGAPSVVFGRFVIGARVNLAAVQQHWTSVANTIQFMLIAAVATYLAAKLMKLPRLPIAVGVALIAFASLRPATASSQDAQFAAIRINHDPLRAIPVGLSPASSASN